ncbi:uncharacterized protein LOC129698047 [Leucoraja erinacea]|uniref:uncharacterized protein LOC129698047 n=1 Tax=Leucoraja erinaceus TaxID=7782 RepID=UPI00245901A1|nr:uncharacterized protein LOC129698047 [Leucoraja erinacea]
MGHLKQPMFEVKWEKVPTWSLQKHLPTIIESAELRQTEATMHHEKGCSSQCLNKENWEYVPGEAAGVPQIEKDCYSTGKNSYAADAAVELQQPKTDVADKIEKNHFKHLSFKDSSSTNSIEKPNEKQTAPERVVGCLSEDVSMISCCAESVNFQEFCMDANSTYNSQHTTPYLVRAMSPSDPLDLTSDVFNSNMPTSKNMNSVLETQTHVERQPDFKSMIQCERIESAVCSDGELLVPINKLEVQVNLNALSNQYNINTDHSCHSVSNWQETAEFLQNVQNKRDIFKGNGSTDPCDVSQQSPPSETEEEMQLNDLQDSTTGQYVKSPQEHLLETSAKGCSVFENTASVLLSQVCKERKQAEYGAQHFIGPPEQLGSFFSNVSNDLTGTDSTNFGVTCEAENYVEIVKLPCTGTDTFSKQEFNSHFDIFEINVIRSEDTKHSLETDGSLLKHETDQVKSMTKMTEKKDSDELKITESGKSKQHISESDSVLDEAALLTSKDEIGQHSNETSTRKTERPIQQKVNEINSNLIITLENLPQSVSADHRPAENLLVSMGSNSTLSTCPQFQQMISMQVTDHAPNSAFEQLSLLHAGKLPEPVPIPLSGKMQSLNSFSKVLDKAVYNSGIPKPIIQYPRTVLTHKGEAEMNDQPKYEGATEAKLIPKPKYVRPKIITYIRKPIQVKPLDIMHNDMGLSSKLSTWSESIAKPSVLKEIKSCENKPLSVLSVPGSSHDRYKPELQRTKIYTTGLMVSGIKPPGRKTFPRMIPTSGEITLKKSTETCIEESISEGESPAAGLIDSEQDMAAIPEECWNPIPSFCRLPMTIRPPLGLGAISRLTAAKSRIALQSQRIPITSTELQIQGQVRQEIAVEQKKNTIPIVQRSSLPKPGHSGLRPPGYSRLPAAKLMAFGFVRSSSLSSVSSNQSNDSGQSDHCKAINRKLQINIVSFDLENVTYLVLKS